MKKDTLKGICWLLFVIFQAYFIPFLFHVIWKGDFPKPDDWEWWTAPTFFGLLATFLGSLVLGITNAILCFEK